MSKMVNIENNLSIFDKEYLRCEDGECYNVCFMLLKFKNIDIIKKIFQKQTDY